jgi:hypothetical protein
LFGVLGRERGGDECFIFDRCEPSERTLAASAVVGPFDPDSDRDAEFVACCPASPVEDVLLEQREERFHGIVVATGADPAIDPTRPLCLIVRTNACERNWLPRSECTIVPDGERSAIAFRNADTARAAVIRSPME